MAQTTIQVSHLTPLTSGLATTDEIIVSDAGVIKKMDISVLEIAASQITASGTLPALNGAALTALTAANITASGTLPALNGAALTALSAANITASGTLPALNGAALTALSASNITASGTLPALNGAALTALVAGNMTAGGTFLAQDGSALTALNGTQVTSGTVPVAQLGSSGTRSSSTFLNGANAWAAVGGTSYAHVHFSIAMTTAAGTQAITGVGFTSKRVFFTARNTTDYKQHSEGVEDWPTGGSDTRFMWYDGSNETSGVWSTDTTNSILVMPTASTAYRGKITTMGSDGFTITWVRTGAPSGTLQVHAYCEG